MDKKIKFLVISSLVSFVCLGLIVGSMFLDTKKTRLIVISVAIGILVVQKIVEILLIKETRKISFVVLIVILAAIAYYVSTSF